MDTEAYSNNSCYIGKIIHVNGQFYAVGCTVTQSGFSIGYVSNDGLAWTEINAFKHEPISYTSIAYGNNTLVAAGFFGALKTSTDGVTWTSGATGETSSFGNFVAYGGDTFVVVGENGAIRQSDPLPARANLTLAASVNQSTFSMGQVLTTTVGLTSPGLPGLADIYVGTLRPDGIIEFLTTTGVVLGNPADPTSFRPFAAGVPLASPFAAMVPNFSSHPWGGGDPHGGYVFFLGVLTAGALADGLITGDEILGIATAPFAFP